MSKNIKLNDLVYTGVSTVQLPTSDGGTASFKDTDEISTPAAGGFALRGVVTEFNKSGANHYHNAASYNGIYPAETVPSHNCGVMIIVFDGADTGTSSVNGIQRIVYVYNTEKAISFQQGYRSGNGVQAASSGVTARSSSDTSLLEIYGGNTYTTYIPSTASSMHVYECELDSETAELIFAQSV